MKLLQHNIRCLPLANHSCKKQCFQVVLEILFSKHVKKKAHIIVISAQHSRPVRRHGIHWADVWCPVIQAGFARSVDPMPLHGMTEGVFC